MAILTALAPVAVWPASGQEPPLELKYFGAAGWEITDGNVVVLIDPWLSRLKYAGPGHPDDDRPDYSRTDIAVADTTLIVST